LLLNSFLIGASPDEVSRTTPELSVFHWERWSWQNFTGMRHGRSTCGFREKSASGQHGSCLERWAVVPLQAEEPIGVERLKKLARHTAVGFPIALPSPLVAW
jgi:hypothetical protein